MSDKIKMAVSWFGDCMGDGTPIYTLEDIDEWAEENDEYDGTRHREFTQEELDFIKKTEKDWWTMQHMLQKEFDKPNKK